MKKKVKIHRLPAGNDGVIITPTKGIGKGLLHFRKHYGSPSLGMGDTSEHLHVLSYEEDIKLGDWFVSFIRENEDPTHPIGSNFIIKATRSNEASWSCLPNSQWSMKAIASTNPVLNATTTTYLHGIDVSIFGLPGIPDDFINSYCSIGGDDEALVEYESTTGYRAGNTKIGGVEIEGTGYDNFKYVLKIDPISSNIFISSAKTEWTRDEVEVLIEKAWIGGGKDCMNKTFDGSENFIKENL